MFFQSIPKKIHPISFPQGFEGFYTCFLLSKHTSDHEHGVAPSPDCSCRTLSVQGSAGCVTPSFLPDSHLWASFNSKGTSFGWSTDPGAALHTRAKIPAKGEKLGVLSEQNTRTVLIHIFLLLTPFRVWQYVVASLLKCKRLVKNWLKAFGEQENCSCQLQSGHVFAQKKIHNQKNQETKHGNS